MAGWSKEAWTSLISTAYQECQQLYTRAGNSADGLYACKEVLVCGSEDDQDSADAVQRLARGKIVLTNDSSCKLARRVRPVDWFADASTPPINLPECGCYRPKARSNTAETKVQAEQKTVKPLEDEE